MQVEELKDLLTVFNLVLGIGAIAYAWLTSRAGEAIRRAAAVEDEVRTMGHRITTLENQVTHLPSTDATQRLELMVTEVKGAIAVLDERLTSLAAVADRLQEFLLEQARRP